MMLPLLEYSVKKEQVLQEYYEQILPQFEAQEDWENPHIVAMCAEELDILMRDTLSLYEALLRTDEFHNYCAVTQSPYDYDAIEHKLEKLFVKLQMLLRQELQLTTSIEEYGYCLHEKHNIQECLKAVDLLLEEESLIYTTEPFQKLLQQSLDDIKAGRITEMTPEHL